MGEDAPKVGFSSDRPDVVERGREDDNYIKFSFQGREISLKKGSKFRVLFKDKTLLDKPSLYAKKHAGKWSEDLEYLWTGEGNRISHLTTFNAKDEFVTIYFTEIKDLKVI